LIKVDKYVWADENLQKHTAGLTALTEKNLAERAGHLEMLAGGKKERKQKSDEKKKS
jgi:hypothetical protein